MQLSDLLRYGDNSKVFVMLNNIKSKLAMQYHIENGTFYIGLEKEEEEKINNISDLRNMAEMECENYPDDWGSLYIAPMEELGDLNLGILKNVIDIKRDENSLVIEDYKIVNISKDNEDNVIIEIDYGI